jgi:hypothetical protein
VIWATDGSEAADRALTYAKTLVSEGGGSYPVHANEAEVQTKIDRRVAELSSNGTGGPRSSAHAAESAARLTRSPSSPRRITPT